VCCATAPEKPGCAPLLRVLGLLNADATLSPDKLKKYRQLNAMCQAIEHAVGGALRQRSDRPLLFVDLCSGSSSHLALLLAFSARFRWERPAHILAVDADATRVVAAKQRASLLGFRSETLHYITSRVASLDAWEKVYAAGFPAAAAAATGRGVRPPHGVFALHACDTATDEAIAFAVRSRARALLIAPCCDAFVVMAQARRSLTPSLSRPCFRSVPPRADASAVVAAESLDTAVVTDTLLDVFVYSLLLGVVALTVYSLVVTLQKSNEEYGGWTPRDDEEVLGAARNPEQRLQSGARYDPVTEQWTYPDPAAVKPSAKVGRAPSAAAADEEASNRYERRMRKKQKAAEKARKRR